MSCNISNFPALSEFISVSEDCQGLKQAGEKRNNLRISFLLEIVTMTMLILMMIIGSHHNIWGWDDSNGRPPKEGEL